MRVGYDLNIAQISLPNVAGFKELSIPIRTGLGRVITLMRIRSTIDFVDKVLPVDDVSLRFGLQVNDSNNILSYSNVGHVVEVSVTPSQMVIDGVLGRRYGYMEANQSVPVRYSLLDSDRVYVYKINRGYTPGLVSIIVEYEYVDLAIIDAVQGAVSIQ